MIAHQAEILADAIRQQLHSTGGPVKRRGLIDLRRLVFDVAETERVTYRGTLEVIGDSAPVLVDAGRDDVRRVLANLLSNATRAAGPTGNVVIEVKVDVGPAEAEVVIDNTVPTVAQAPEGTGLGWSIIIQMLTRIDGTLAYGQGRRGGVRATLSLPLAMC
jgi:signal transduction histidine kinase